MPQNYDFIEKCGRNKYDSVLLKHLSIADGSLLIMPLITGLGFRCTYSTLEF